jgi:transporter family protein
MFVLFDDSKRNNCLLAFYYEVLWMKWLFFSLIAVICWGVWGIFTKMSLKYYGWQQIYIIAGVVTMVTSCILFIFTIRQNGSFTPISIGFNYALYAGIASTIALLSFYYAVKLGKVSIVVPLSALYPIVTVTLSGIFLGEKITLLQGTGIIFAILAIFLLSTS